MQGQLILPTAEPFFFPGGKTGCLLVHGFTGTPKEMRWLGEYLAAQGHTVFGVRLAGHATRPKDMVRTRWPDWLASVEDGLHVLRSVCDHVFILGLSMGGALSLLAAARYPIIQGVVALSTPLYVSNDWRVKYLRWFQYIMPEVGKGAPDWHDAKAAQAHLSYPTYPTRSLAELNDLLAEMRASLAAIHAPVLLMQSHADSTIPPESMDTLYTQIGSATKEKLWLENSGHVITREPERDTVFHQASRFIDACLEEAGALQQAN